MDKPSASDALRIGARLLAMALWLAICLPPCLALRLLADGPAGGLRTNPWSRRFLTGVGWIIGLRLRVTGEPAAGRRLILANHVSWTDVPVLAHATGAAFVAHDGLAGIAPLRWLCELNDTVFVARHARASIGGQIETLRAALATNGALAVFPEGTTSDGTGLLAFKSSLLAALESETSGVAGPMLDVQPVWIDYGPRSDVAWVGEEPGLSHAFRILARRRPIAVTVHLLPPLSGAALAGRKAMAAAARGVILEAMILGE